MGRAVWVMATAAPAISVPANRPATPPVPRNPAPAAVRTAPAARTRSRPSRRPSDGASGASAPKHSTGPVVSSPAAVAERPRSSRTSSSSGGRPAKTVRKLRASRTMAATTPRVGRAWPAALLTPGAFQRGRQRGSTPSVDDPRYEDGMKVRREVLGDEHVDRAAGNASDFTRPWQEHITASAWGGVWSRPGLDRRTRSVITVSVLTALGRREELAMHLRGA